MRSSRGVQVNGRLLCRGVLLGALLGGAELVDGVDEAHHGDQGVEDLASRAALQP